MSIAPISVSNQFTGLPREGERTPVRLLNSPKVKVPAAPVAPKSTPDTASTLASAQARIVTQNPPKKQPTPAPQSASKAPLATSLNSRPSKPLLVLGLLAMMAKKVAGFNITLIQQNCIEKLPGGTDLDHALCINQETGQITENNARTSTSAIIALGVGAAVTAFLALIGRISSKRGAARHLTNDSQLLLADTLGQLNRQVQDVTARGNAPIANFLAIKHGVPTTIPATPAVNGINSLVTSHFSSKTKTNGTGVPAAWQKGKPTSMDNIDDEINRLINLPPNQRTEQSFFLKKLVVDIILDWWTKGPQASICTVLYGTQVPQKESFRLVENRSALARFVFDTLNQPNVLQTKLKGESLDTCLLAATSSQDVVSYLHTVFTEVLRFLQPNFPVTVMPQRTSLGRRLSDIAYMRDWIGATKMRAASSAIVEAAKAAGTTPAATALFAQNCVDLATQIQAKITQ
ncbi:MAG: hypothetical protein AB7F28_02550 [Candidatus Margulisiibacteriota bacterium]